tara:strand:+ start:2284 stop:2574 length:291 start_codon:yes stop_codon:yes gene_type:complete
MERKKPDFSGLIERCDSLRVEAIKVLESLELACRAEAMNLRQETGLEVFSAREFLRGAWRDIEEARKEIIWVRGEHFQAAHVDAEQLRREADVSNE